LIVRSRSSEVSERPPKATLVKIGLPCVSVLKTLPDSAPAVVWALFSDSA
jgi:hypothetical protein